MTAYNSSFAYGAHIRYDGVGATATSTQTISFDPPRRRVPEPPKPEQPAELYGTVRGISVATARITGTVDTTQAVEEDLQLLGLI